ncbi:MAG: acyl-CoA synthetase, partial [Mucilaginibacter sp.]
ANYVPLSPLSFLSRTAATYPNLPSVIYGSVRYNWAQTYARCKKLASALANAGIGFGDTVAVMLPNVPAMFEVHFGVPMTGAVLNTLNIRLDARTIGFMLQHAEAKVLITDKEFSDVINGALAGVENKPIIINVNDAACTAGSMIGDIEYENFIAPGDENYNWQLPGDEWNAISLNYTSGTTGNPKGVVYHHRGAYLNAINNGLTWGMPNNPVYLWTLPMFHCNGWCFPWTIAAFAGTNVCLRKVVPQDVYRLIAAEKVTHLCGAPVVLGMLANATDEQRTDFDHKVELMTAGASPPAAVIENIEKRGFYVTHTYGLTETYGPAVVCAWQKHWDDEPVEVRSALKSRQGVKYLLQEGLMVADPETMVQVPPDGITLGEVFMRGNIVMKGYVKNPSASDAAFTGGWFHTGDLGVMHPDGYIHIKDRSKDIIISGGENISTIEVEDVLYRHKGVAEAAVVARPDEKWGETVCAFINPRPGTQVTADEVKLHCRENLPGFKVPHTVIFCELPKTATGKIQKFVLRKWAAELVE